MVLVPLPVITFFLALSHWMNAFVMFFKKFMVVSRTYDLEAEAMRAPPSSALHKAMRSTSTSRSPRAVPSTMATDDSILPRFMDSDRQGTLQSVVSPFHQSSLSLSEPAAPTTDNQASPQHQDAPPDGTALQPNMEEEDTGSGIFFIAVTPLHIMDDRYRRHYQIPRQCQDDRTLTVKSLQTKFEPLTVPASPALQSELTWKICKSPEGNLYFREANENIVTFVDLFNEEYRRGISNFAVDILRIKGEQKDIPTDAELVLMLEDYGDGAGYGYGYYLATWHKSCVFWLEDVDYARVTKETRVCLTESHIEQQIEYLFWIHAEIFPCHHVIPCDVIKRLRRELNLGVFDHITSDNSIFPYDKGDATEIIKCLDRIEPLDQDVNDVWIIARCKQSLAQYRFFNYHGERGARIHRFDSVQNGTIRLQRSLLFHLITPILFFMPSVYMKEIEAVWIDETVDWISWRTFITKLDKDWNQSMTPATVILSANVGFLAINSIDNAQGVKDRSAAQIASYFSSVLSFFFFITVQILTHQHRSSQYFAASRACDFLKRRSKRRLGLESIALTYSLPTALFIWSMLTFLAALMIVFFWNTTVVTQVLMAIAVGILLILTAILLWLDWDNHSGMHGPYEVELPPHNSPVFTRLIRRLGLVAIYTGIQRVWNQRTIRQLTPTNKSRASLTTSESHESDTSSTTAAE